MNKETTHKVAIKGVRGTRIELNDMSVKPDTTSDIDDDQIRQLLSLVRKNTQDQRFKRHLPGFKRR